MFRKFLKFIQEMALTSPKTWDEQAALAEEFYSKGEYQQSISYYWQALKLLEIDGNSTSHQTAVLYNDMGIAYKMLALKNKLDIHYENSIKCYKKALEIWITLYGKEHATIARCYNNLGVVYRAQKKILLARQYLDKSLAIKKQLGDNTELRLTARNLIIAKTFDKMPSKNISNVQNKSTPKSPIKHIPIGRHLRFKLFGDAHYNRGNYHVASNSYTEALYEGRGHKKDSFNAEVYNKLAKIQFKQNNHHKAAEYYKKAFELNQKNIKYLIKQGLCYKMNEQNGEAESLFKQAAFNLIEQNDCNALKLLNKIKIKLNYKYIDHNNDTVLHLAVRHRRRKIIRYCLKHKLVDNINSINNSGETALHVAAKTKDLVICSALILGGVNEEIKDNEHKESGSYLSESERRDLFSIHQKIAKKSIPYILNGVTSCLALKGKRQNESFKLTHKIYSQLSSELGSEYYSTDIKRYIRPVLILAADMAADKDRITINTEPNRETVNAVTKMSTKKTTLGVFYHSGVIVVGANVNERSENEIAGTLIHEICHSVALFIFHNDCKPYRSNESIEAGLFGKICEEIKQKHISTKNLASKDDELDPILRSVFTCYESSSYHCELIARVPQMIVQYGSDIGLKHLREQVPRLLRFYEESFLTECRNYHKKGVKQIGHHYLNHL
jgi:tetratricopeptide (TPR) repeat protein